MRTHSIPSFLPSLLIIVLSLFVLTMPVQAREIPWAAPDTIAGGFNGATDAITADLDGDGDLDVLAAAKAAHDIAWWENTAGDGSAWTKHFVDDHFLGAVSVQAADIDRDGDLDVVAAGYDGDGRIAWFENTAGDGSTWTERVIDSTYGGARDVYAADVDGDGHLDVLGAAEIDDDITWWENDGTPDNGGWTEHTIAGAFDGAWAVYAADLDGDDDLDVLGARAAGGGIAWWGRRASPCRPPDRSADGGSCHPARRES